MPEPTNSPLTDGPWSAWTGFEQIYDAGIGWCVNAAGHPDANGGYPHRDIHVPAFECRTLGSTLDDVCIDLDGPPLTLEVYAARPFRFGLPRVDGPRETRVVIEFVDDATDDARRLSISRGEALRLARLLQRLVDRVTYL